MLCYALFAQVGTNFIKNRNNPDAFEPAPTAPQAAADKAAETDESVYTVNVNGVDYVVEVTPGGDISALHSAQGSTQNPKPAVNTAPVPSADAFDVKAPLAGTVIKTVAAVSDVVAEGDTLIVLEAMKMETNISAARAGTISSITVKAGDGVSVGDILLQIT